jgi:hypothetical protein
VDVFSLVTTFVTMLRQVWPGYLMQYDAALLNLAAIETSSNFSFYFTVIKKIDICELGWKKIECVF